ncbi:hypothetical protein [Ectobacillus funiculus]|uniref:hypothetical protein n=1 Tax=Ectobacillus funiculus TaxID=137993 RepID=UPI00101DB004|nr:hypothetical protein [Ectobacillus funiculus]
MPFDNSLKNIQTPGRVHALCKLLLLESYSQEKLMELLQPDSDKTQAKDVFKLARNGGLVSLDENKKVHLQVPKSEVLDSKRFAHYVAGLAFENKDFIFGRFSAWVMTRGEKVLTETRDELAERFFNEVSRKYTSSQEFNSTNIIGWMTWANYFGMGHTLNSKFVVNPANRIRNELEFDQELPRGEFIRVQEFMDWIVKRCPELDGGTVNLEFNDQFSNQQLSFAFSLALRTLHDLQIIILQNTRDVKNIWYLHEVQTHEIPNQVTDIMVKG